MALNSQNITIQEIAQLAKVSVATVSRTLSNPDKVSELTRQQVLAAIESTGYSVNENARNLRKRQTDTIVVMTLILVIPISLLLSKVLKKYSLAIISMS